MEFFTRMLSGNSRPKERAREAEQVNEAFNKNLDNLKAVLESEERSNVYTLLDMIYESSFPEEQIFMKTPSRTKLKSKRELLVRLLIGLDALGVPTTAEMLVFVRKHGTPEGISESLVTLLELLSPLLDGKETPEFTTDDVVDAMDFEWHSTSKTGSPLLNVIASATSSPRASAASIGDSPLNPIVSTSPFRRAVSDRSMFLSRSHELGTKFVLDKASPSALPHHPTLTTAASAKFPYANQHFDSKEVISDIAASPEIILTSTLNEKPPSYSLDTLPASSEQRPQRRHRRQSSSLQQLFSEETIDEVSWEGSIGASSKRNSSSSSWRRNSSEFLKFLSNVSGSGTSSPINPGLGGPDKEVLSSSHTQDRQFNRSSRKGSRHFFPPPPHTEAALIWREDIDGLTLDLVSSNKNPSESTSVSSDIHEKSSGAIHETEKHIDGMEGAPLFEDAPKLKKSILEQDDILLIHEVSPDVSRASMSQIQQDQCHTNKQKEVLDDAIDVQRGDSANDTSAKDPKFEPGGVCRMLQDHNEVNEHRNEQYVYEGYGDNSVENTILVHENGNLIAAQIKGDGEDECNKVEDGRSISDNYHDLNVGYVDAYGVSPHENRDFLSESEEHERSSAHNSTSSSAQETNFDTTDCIILIKDELKKQAFNGDSEKFLQIEQRRNALQHGHYRSHSDLTPVRSLFKTESFLHEKQKKSINGSPSECDAEMDILRRRFARRLRSLTASMESLMVREGSPGRVVMQESMPWTQQVDESSHGKEEIEEQIGKGSASESESSSSGESTSSSSSSADDAGCKFAYEDGKPITPHEMEAEVHSSSVYTARQPCESELGSQCKRDADSKEHARHAHSLDINHEEADAKHATYLSDMTHEEQAGVAYSLDSHEEGAMHAHDVSDRQQQNEPKNVSSDEINREGFSIQEGTGIQWSLASLLLPSSRNVCEDADDQPANIHENESLQGAQQVDIKAEIAPRLLKGQDEKDKVLDDMVVSISDEKEDVEIHATVLSSEDLQTTLETVDSKQCSSIHAVNMSNGVPLPLVHAWVNITEVPIDEERGHLHSDVPTTTSHAELSDDPHQYDRIEVDGNIQDNLSMKRGSLRENAAATDGANIEGSFNEGIESVIDVDPLSLNLEQKMQKISSELIKEDNIKGNLYPMDLHVDVASPPCGATHDQEPCTVNAGLEEYEEASSKVNKDIKQGLQYPLMVEEVLQEGLISKPCWETSEVVDASRSQPLHDDDYDDRMQGSAAQITDLGLVVQVRESKGQCAVNANSLHDDDDDNLSRRSATQFMDSGRQVAANANSLHDDDNRIQRSAMQFTDSGRQGPAVNANSLHDDGDDDDHIQQLEVQFTDSGRQCVGSNASIRSHSLHDEDHIQQPAMQVTDSRSSSAVSTGDDPYRLIHAGPLHFSKIVDLRAPNLHGHPNVDPQQHTDQHVLHQPATFHDPTIGKWDIDINERRYEKRSSRVGKLARCLSCCRKPHTNP